MITRKIFPLNQSLLLRAVFLTVFLSTACLAGLASFIVVRELSAAWTGSVRPSGPQIVPGQPTPAADMPGNPAPGNSEQPVIAPSLNPWDGASRVTILILGLDYRDWESGSRASRSDTMILLTLDPLTKTAGILSIPRDMWVSIPGSTHGKINTAHYIGEARKLPGGGPGLAIKTVEQFLGVPINYYAQIDFEAFVRFIDEIGGVKIDVPEKITVDLLGSGAKTKKNLQPGVQVLPGEWALAYARARYTEEGDFDRARRQQQVIMGIRNRILSLDMLPTLITKAPTLYRELSSGINTNLSLDQVIKLALLAQQVPEENIQRGVLGKEYVLFGRSPDNLSILIPIPDKIHVLRDQIFATATALGPETPGNAKQQMQAEAANIAVLNGSRLPDLATHTADYLRSQGANVTQTGDADQAYTVTTIVDYTGNPYSLKYLVETLQISPSRIYSRFDPTSSVDVEISLGNDWANNNTLP
jgi:LCP family protein required for cell wall assembly